MPNKPIEPIQEDTNQLEMIQEDIKQLNDKQIEMDGKINKLYGIFSKLDNIQRWIEPTNQLAAQNNQLLTEVLSTLQNTQPFEGQVSIPPSDNVHEFHPEPQAEETEESDEE